MVPLEGDRILVLSGNITQVVYLCQVHSRQNEHDCRRPLQTGPNSSNKVVTPPGHCQSHIPTVGSPHSRPLCHEIHHKVCDLCVPNTRQRALDTDALAMSWEGIFACAFPPHQILNQVLQKFSQTRCCSLVLVALWWPKQVWFPTLQRLSRDRPVPLPPWDKMLKQPRSDVYHQFPCFLNLHAWRLYNPP